MGVRSEAYPQQANLKSYTSYVLSAWSEKVVLRCPVTVVRPLSHKLKPP